MNTPTLSVVTTCNDAISNEYYLEELIRSVWDIATEIIILNGDDSINPDGPGVSQSETDDCIWSVFRRLGISEDEFSRKVKIHYNRYEPRLGAIMTRIQKSIAISHATESYVLLLDADEVIHENDHDKIRKCLELGHFAYATKTLHFYRDYKHIKVGPGWYDFRTRLFKNNSYVFDTHDHFGNYSCDLVYANMHREEGKRKFTSLMEHPDKQLTSIEVFHAGHCRSKEVYLRKKNQIERAYHPDWVDLSVEDWDWDMSDTEVYEGDYPEALKERIEKHKKEYPEYYR